MTENADDIFIIEELSFDDEQISAKLRLNKGSAIFKGHFPGQPVVPGACMVQLVKDVLRTALNADVFLKRAANIKFISIITPDAKQSPELQISYKTVDDISVNAKITIGDITCFKLQAIYTKL